MSHNVNSSLDVLVSTYTLCKVTAVGTVSDVVRFL